MSNESPNNTGQPLSSAQLRKLQIAAWVGAALIAATMAWGFYSRMQAQAALSEQTNRAAITAVTVTTPLQAADGDSLVLPGSVQAFTEAPIYARTSGYLKRWYADIGKPVKSGELLAEVETPEVDAQWLQAKADLATAQANYKLSQITATRWLSLLDSGVVAKQDVDDKVGDAEAKKAEVESARANVTRLEQLEGFKRIVAPFDGIITVRGTDVGALINAGSTSGQELFHIAAIDKLRVYIQVPQQYAAAMQPGMAAELHFTEHPEKTYPAMIVNTARAIDSSTRTLLVELSAENPRNELLPGAYTEVHLKPAARVNTLQLPSNALLFRSEGMLVATVDQNNRVVMKSVQLGRDFGKQVEILSGLEITDRVVLNPSDSLTSGAQVRVVTGQGS
jgi:RND family efflux transporter MFP subunit